MLSSCVVASYIVDGCKNIKSWLMKLQQCISPMRNSSNCLSLCNLGASDICRVLTVTGKLVNVGIMWAALAVNVTILKILLLQSCCRK